MLFKAHYRIVSIYMFFAAERFGLSDAAVALALQLGSGGRQLEYRSRGTVLHDTGKMAISDRIVLKPEAPDEAEGLVMKQHPQIASVVMNAIDYLKPCVNIPKCHPERWNGAGFPRGFAG